MLISHRASASLPWASDEPRMFSGYRCPGWITQMSILQMVMGMERGSWLSKTRDLSSDIPAPTWFLDNESFPTVAEQCLFLSSWPLQPSPVLSVLLISLLSLFFLIPSRGEKYFSNPGKAALCQYCYFFFSQWHLLYFDITASKHLP